MAKSKKSQVAPAQTASEADIVARVLAAMRAASAAPVAPVVAETPAGFHRSKTSGSVSLAVDYLAELGPKNPKGTLYIKGPRMRRLIAALKIAGIKPETERDLERIASILDAANPSD